MRRVVIAVAACGALAAPSLASSQAVQTLLLGGSAPVWQWNPAATNALPSDGSVTYTGAALGGLVRDASGNLTYKPNNLVLYSGNFVAVAGYWNPVSGASVTADTGPDGTATNKIVGTSQFTDGVDNGSKVYYRADINNTVVGGRASVIAQAMVYSATDARVQVAAFAWAGTNAYSYQTIPAGTWVTLYAKLAQNTSNTGNTGIVIYPGANTIYVKNVRLSAVTGDTTPRPQDAVVTTSAAYYGPPCDYGTGCRKWAARTNLFLNSGSPATQNITTTAQQYTVSCYGSGSLTLSGTATGTATCGGTYPTPGSVTVTATAGTLTVTKSGSPTYPQVEAGAFPSPPIPTGASAVASAADSYALAGAGAAAVAAGPWAYQQIDGQTGATSCVTGAAGAFSWPTNVTIKSIKAFPPGAVPRC